MLQQALPFPAFSFKLFNSYAEEIDQDDTSGAVLAAFIAKLNPSEALSGQVMTNVRTHVEREIDLALEYEFRFGRDLMEINDTEEEGLLFEITDMSEVEADMKEQVLKSFIEREREVIREVIQ